MTDRFAISRIGSLSTLAAFTLIGCGGGGSSVQNQVATNTASDASGIGQASKVGKTIGPMAATATPQTVTVSVNGSSTTGIMPANQSLTAGEKVAVLQGIVLSNTGFVGNGIPPKVASSARPALGQVGSMDVDGVKIYGLMVLGTYLGEPLILAPGYHTLKLLGPLVISNSIDGAQLTVNDSITLGVTVASDGTVSLPKASRYLLPVNGGSWTGCSISDSYPSGFATGGSTTLQIVVSGAETIQQTKAIGSGPVVFSNLDPTGSFTVPKSGLSSISITVTQAPPPAHAR